MDGQINEMNQPIKSYASLHPGLHLSLSWVLYYVHCPIKYYERFPNQVVRAALEEAFQVFEEYRQ